MELIPCPYLGQPVELSDERRQHIAERHPDLLPKHIDRVRETLTEPDRIRKSERFSEARLFTRKFEDKLSGKYVVVVVVTETAPRRHWVITAYIARSLGGGEIEWTRD
jgi:hypothetical protein